MQDHILKKDSNNNIAQLSLAAAEMYGGDTTGATARFHKALASMNLLNSTKYLSDYLDPYVKAGIDKGQAMTLITQLKTMQDIEEARKKTSSQREQPKDDSIIHVGNLIIVKNPTNPIALRKRIFFQLFLTYCYFSSRVYRHIPFAAWPCPGGRSRCQSPWPCTGNC